MDKTISAKQPQRATENELERYVRRLMGQANESPAALQGAPVERGTHDARGAHEIHIVRPGNALEYQDSALVGWWPLREMREQD